MVKLHSATESKPINARENILSYTAVMETTEYCFLQRKIGL